MAQHGTHGLTRREQDILRAILTLPDATHADLAGTLGISAKTLQVHIRNLCSKLDCRTTRGLLVKALQLGVLPALEHAHQWRAWRQCSQCGLSEAVPA